MRFVKPALSIADQITLLERRQMVIVDRASASHYLQHLSYYRLRAYWMSFEIPSPTPGDHLFRPGTTFDSVIELYAFDRNFRLLVLSGIERIEVSFRGVWAHHIAMNYGPHGYLDHNIYSSYATYLKQAANFLREVEQSKETFIKHYKSTYNDPDLPPIWAAAELMSLGSLSKWIQLLKHRRDRVAISRSYNLPEPYLFSFIHHLTYVRNICAHHGRLWNKDFVVTSAIPQRPVDLGASMNISADRKVFNTITGMMYIINHLSPNSGWKADMKALINGYAALPMAQMGFPADWQTRPVWR